MRHARVALTAISILLSYGTAHAGASAVPVLVSPGSPDEFTALVGACPTFSWAVPMHGESQELVVYEVDASGAVAADPTLALRLPALATSWTPSAAECLERGKSYAWSLRPVGDSGHSEWGETRFFSVPAPPSEEELRAGLEVVKTYLALREGASPGAEGGQRTGGPGIEERDSSLTDRDTELSDARIRTARAGAVNTFRVGPGGAVEAASFTGDGSGLRNVGSAAIATNAVGSTEIATNAVTSAELADNSVGPLEIAPNSVDTDELVDTSVNSAKIAAGAVGASEMAGHFCLVKRIGFACPAAYTEYYIKFDTEDTNNSDICTEGEVAEHCYGSSVGLKFCCK